MNRILPIVVLIAFAGCGQKKADPVVASPEPEPVIRPTESTEGSAAVTKEEVEKPDHLVEPDASRMPLAVTANDGTAEATFQQILIAFQDGKLDRVYEFLPAANQADLQGLLSEFAKSMDADVWTKAFSLLRLCANVMRSKKSQFLNLELLKRSPQYAHIAASWDAIAGGIDDVGNSEVANLNDLKQADLKRLLASASALLSGIPLPRFGNVQVSTVDSDELTATLAYRESKDGDLKQVEFVKIDGKWMPKSLSGNWSDEVAQFKKRLAWLSEGLKSSKSRVMQSLESITELINGVESAGNQEEFNLAVIKLIFSIRLESLMALDAIQSGSAVPRRESAIRVDIARELTDDELTKLRDSLQAAHKGDAVEYEMVPGDGKTRCRFAPIADRTDLVSLLKKQFEGADVQLDADTRTIRVEWK